MLKKFFFILFLGALLFTRFWNVNNTARFTRDESYDIVKLHQYWVEKKITLIGAIDYTGSIVYSSAFYYLIMPFAVLGNFEPDSTAYAASFYGLITAIIFLILAYKVNRNYLHLSGLLILFWFPLLQASRWSWNPHLVPLWMALGISAYLKNKKIFLFLSGVFFGIAFHIHYISFVSTAVFLGVSSLYNFFKKRYSNALLPIFGFILLIVPYAIFDLRHPPGLFFSGYLRRNIVTQEASYELARFPETFLENIENSFLFLTQFRIFSKIVLLCLAALVYSDLRRKRYLNLFYFFPIPAQIAIISFLPNYGTRYFLPSLAFLYVYLILRRKGFESVISKLIIFLFILAGLFSLKSILNKPILEPGPRVVKLVSSYIKDKVTKEGLKNVNLAVLSSPDPDPIGLSYRDILLTKGVAILPASQYMLTDNLFIISTSSEETIRTDPTNIMQGFRKGEIASIYQIIKSEWKVYLFLRDKK